MIDVEAIHRSTTPLGLAQALGLVIAPGARPDRCRVRHHGEAHPSCDIAVRDGRVVWSCRSCSDGGDAIALAADTWGMHRVRDFRRVAQRLGDLLGVRVEDDGNPSARGPTSTRRDPVLDVAQALDGAADDWIAGREMKRADLDVIAAARGGQLREAMRVLDEHDAATGAFNGAVDDEMDRLADAYDHRHADCECNGGTKPHTTVST